jgi:uncharacterized RDD family membrane protein YckC
VGTPDPAPPPPPPGGPPGGAPVGLIGRFVARLLDAVIVGIPVSIVLAMAGLPAQTFGLGGVEAWTAGAVTAVLWFAYYVGFESSSGGATLGKRIMRARVVTADGGSPSVQAAAIRNLWLLFGLIPLVGGIAQLIAVIVIAVTISSSPEHRGKHDEFAGTGVVSR